MDALLIPALGTVFWASIAFLVVLFVLRKFAWGPILSALNDREQSIAGALNEADRVRKEMEALAASNENQLQEARAEREKMMREAREMADQMISDPRTRPATQLTKKSLLQKFPLLLSERQPLQN
jgi:F-type H+-transporting ATPase subunit b